jgi:hypothetical protein
MFKLDMGQRCDWDLLASVCGCDGALVRSEDTQEPNARARLPLFHGLLVARCTLAQALYETPSSLSP